MNDIKPLSDYVWFQEGPGVRNTQYTQSGVKLLNVANLVDGRVDISNTDRYISEEEAYGKYRHFLVDEGDLIIASSGIKVEYFDEKMGFVENRHLPLCMNTSTIRFKTKDENKLNIRYFMYFLKSEQFKNQLARQITGSAQLNFGPSHLKKMDILLKEIAEQEEIVIKLDKLNGLINKRKQQLEKLDLLVKSKFIEMFGGYDLRNVKSDWVKIGAVAEVVGGSTPKTESNEFWGGAHYWITPAEISDDNFIIERTQRTLTDAGVRSCSLRLLPVGTVLLSSRAPIGKVAIAGVEMYCNQGFKNLICTEEINSIYVFYLLKFNSQFLNSLGRGATFKEISKSIVENILIPAPSIQLQNEFANFVEQTEKAKHTIKQSLEKLETLKKALMQKYFG